MQKIDLMDVLCRAERQATSKRHQKQAAMLETQPLSRTATDAEQRHTPQGPSVFLFQILKLAL